MKTLTRNSNAEATANIEDSRPPTQAVFLGDLAGQGQRERPSTQMNGFRGQIAISLRSKAQHPKGGPQARGICALTPKTPDPDPAPEPRSRAPFLVRAEPVEAFSPPFGLSLSKPRVESSTSVFAEFRCRSIAAAGDLLFFASPKKPEEKKGDPGYCVGLLGSDANFAAVQSIAPSGEPQARRIWTLTPKTQPAVLGKSGVPLELGYRLKQSRSLIRFSLRSSVHPQGFEGLKLGDGNP